MRKAISRLGRKFPESAAKNAIRRAAFPLMFATSGHRTAHIGSTQDKVSATIARLLWYDETLGEREIDGYLQHYVPTAGDVVVNAGGYHGYFAIYLALKVGASGRVLCFEPDVTNLRILKRNIALNHLNNVTVIPKGLWSHDTQLSFQTMGSGSRIVSGMNLTTRIEACSLDAELKRHNIENVDFVSMDIEGAEIEAIKGATKTLAATTAPKLAIASYHIVDGQQTCRSLEPALTKLGYAAHTAFPDHLTTYAQKRA